MSFDGISFTRLTNAASESGQFMLRNPLSLGRLLRDQPLGVGMGEILVDFLRPQRGFPSSHSRPRSLPTENLTDEFGRLLITAAIHDETDRLIAMEPDRDPERRQELLEELRYYTEMQGRELLQNEISSQFPNIATENPEQIVFLIDSISSIVMETGKAAGGKKAKCQFRSNGSRCFESHLFDVTLIMAKNLLKESFAEYSKTLLMAASHDTSEDVFDCDMQKAFSFLNQHWCNFASQFEVVFDTEFVVQLQHLQIDTRDVHAEQKNAFKFDSVMKACTFALTQKERLRVMAVKIADTAANSVHAEQEIAESRDRAQKEKLITQFGGYKRRGGLFKQKIDILKKNIECLHPEVVPGLEALVEWFDRCLPNTMLAGDA